VNNVQQGSEEETVFSLEGIFVF